MPCGGLTWSRICPESTYGKKSWPMKNDDRQGQNNKAREEDQGECGVLKTPLQALSCNARASARTDVVKALYANAI